MDLVMYGLCSVVAVLMVYRSFRVLHHMDQETHHGVRIAYWIRNAGGFFLLVSIFKLPDELSWTMTAVLLCFAAPALVQQRSRELIGDRGKHVRQQPARQRPSF